MIPQLLSRMAQRISASPDLATFISEVESFVSSDETEAFWQCREGFAKLIQSSFLRDVVNYELGRVKAEPHYVPTMIFENLMVIAKTKWLTIAARLYQSEDPEPTSLYGINEHQLIGVLDPGTLRIMHYRQPAPHPHDVLNRSSRLLRQEDQLLQAASIFTARAAEEVFLLRAVSGSVLAITLGSRPLYRVRWQYDRSTLYPNKLVAVDDVSSRLEYTAWMLSELCDSSSVPALLDLMSHPAHQVRWASIRAIMRLDQARGLRLLQGALSDCHPHVRNAARRSLEKLGIPPSTPAGESSCSTAPAALG